MKDNLTEIVIVLDKSGSMESVQMETIHGFNKFLHEQQKAPGEARLTLVLFDTNVEVVHSGVDIKAVPDLTAETYSPDGWTALYDAVMRAINDTGNRLAATPEPERPGKVIFVIMTDGAENASREFAQNPAAVRSKIKHQEDKYSWNFVYIGANQDAFAVGGDLGIRSGMIANYVSDSAGTSKAYNDVSKGMLHSRSAKDCRISNYFDPNKP